MPEGSEIHIFASLINRNCQGKTFLRVSQTAWPKNATISLPWSEFRVSAVARGKELQLTCVPALEVPGARPVVYTFNHGLVGIWDWVTASSLAKAPVGTQLMFHTATHSLVYMDKMKMGGWQETSEWGKGRSPDALLEFFDFCNQTVALIAKKQPAVPICVTLNDQAYFNGVGNYLRAEILNRAGLDPFQQTMNVFAATPKNINLQSFASIMTEATADPKDIPSLKKSLKHDPGLMILFLTRQIQMEVLVGGMNKYGTPDEQSKFTKWLRVYGKGTEVKVAGRSVHCTPEQRLGKQERDLGSFVNRYPFDLSGLFYKSPTVTIVSETQAATFSSASSSGKASSTSSGTFNVNRIEENILPCSQIVSLHVPIISKLLLATTALSRSGKLNFVEESAVRETLLDEHPVAYSAWQVFEANGDEDDLVDTLKRLANATAPMRKQREEWTNAISMQLASLSIPQASGTSTQFGTMAPQAHLPTALPTIEKPMLASRFFDLASVDHSLAPKAKKASKRDRFSETKSSTSSSASSIDDDNLSDDDDELSPPKKKMPASLGSGLAKKKKKVSKFDPPANLKSGTGAFGKPSPSTSPNPSSSTASSSLDFLQLLGEKSWLSHLGGYIKVTKQLHELGKFLSAAYLRNDPPVYPPVQDIFNAFKLCPLDKVKVVILGQDPYHGPGQAHGLCFSVLRPVAPPPSLVNIFKELETDILGFKSPTHGDLTSWGNQGVFLLNTVLTVFQQKPNSHANMGWEGLTDLVIKTILESRTGVVFMLWGGMAQKKASMISKYDSHHVLSAPHPSPLSAFNGWFGCKHFSKANTLLQASGQTPVDWNIAN